jgi:hypothetical protein
MAREKKQGGEPGLFPAPFRDPFLDLGAKSQTTPHGIGAPPPLPMPTAADLDDEPREHHPTEQQLSQPTPQQANSHANADDFGQSNTLDHDPTAPPRRVARRRPAGPVRTGVAANDDAPTIGGLIFALEQKPSNAPYRYAALFSVLWGALGVAIAGISIWSELGKAVPLATILVNPMMFLTVAAIGLPIGVIWFLALLAWRAEELRLRSSTMTEVAVRLAEPDRMAEQAVTSLGQNIRRQVSFVNDAVSRAIGRASELEALVHGEVAALERSYEENEIRIRNLIQELSGERHALLNTSERVAITLRTLGSEVPTLIDKLADQQIKLTGIIEGAGQNLSALEGALAQSAGQLDASLGSRTVQLQGVLDNYASQIDIAMSARSDELQLKLTSRVEEMQVVLQGYTSALADVLASRTDEMQIAFDDSMRTLDTSLGGRTENLQTVFEEYARALDTTLANRAQALDVQLVERTAALDSAFGERLRVFDESIQRSAMAIDGAVNERASALTGALDKHAKTFRETITRQSSELDESLMHGITAVRRTSENITRQSLKAIEGLAGQSDLLKNVSENLLGQINSVTNRFENQGQQIMKAANALETANYKIDTTLQTRHADLTRTLDRISGSADEFGKVMTDYSSQIEGTLTDAERRARLAAEDLRSGAESRSQEAIEAITRLRTETADHSERALDDLRRRFSTASSEVHQQLGSLNERVSETTLEVRNRAALAATAVAQEEALLRQQIDQMPTATRQSAEVMRRSLQDQIQALDQLNQITQRGAQSRDVSPPVASLSPMMQSSSGVMQSSSGVMQSSPHMQPSQVGAALAGTYGGEPRAPQHENERGLSSLSTALSNAMGTQRATPPARVPVQPEPPQPWSFGDLLARASHDEASHGGSMGGGSQGAPPAPFSLNVAVIARALDQPSAEAIWARLRAGQRGIMTRNFYSIEGRTAFDEISRRALTDTDLQATIGRYLADFERILKDAEARDPSGRLLQTHLGSDTGRVYLFLAHASGRLT